MEFTESVIPIGNVTLHPVYTGEPARLKACLDRAACRAVALAEASPSRDVVAALYERRKSAGFGLAHFLLPK